ncbi:MAG: DUF488 domain-containing protein [Clostridia bacterium]|nr:DUF488 domain-containing protein [Clostridia bacterium]
MIFIGRINEVKPGEYDETYAIVRSMKNPSPWMAQLVALSPSKALFFDYLSLKKAGTWNADTFKERYVPMFMQEIAQPAPRKVLEQLVEYDRMGRKMALVCFCPDETLCHRSIVAGILQGMGADVRLRSGADYSAYYERYKEMLP